MKTLVRTNKHVVLVVGVILGMGVVAYAQQQNKAKNIRKVEIKDKSIVIHPSIKLSADDAKKMDVILAKHSKNLYRIDTVKNGKLIKRQGEISDARTGPTLTAEVNTAESATMRTPPVRSDSHVHVWCPWPPCITMNAQRNA